MKIILSLLLFLGGNMQYIYAQFLPNIEGKTLAYDAFFIEHNGDTLTSEIIKFHFTSQPWTINSQNELKYTYFTDTTAIKDFTHPFKSIEKKQQKKANGKPGWENWTWLDTMDITGYILNDSIFWIHPPRDNQYLYNEISGMPHIVFNKLFVGGSWESKLIIMMGWYEFKGTVKTSYHVETKTDYSYKNISRTNIWKIKSSHHHSKLGKYQSTIFFDETQFGFLSFENSFHDGRKIVLRLIEIE